MAMIRTRLALRIPGMAVLLLFLGFGPFSTRTSLEPRICRPLPGVSAPAPYDTTFRDYGPYLSSWRLTLDDVQALLPYELPRPSHHLANDSSIRAVFVENGSGKWSRPPDEAGWTPWNVAIDYDSGILLMIRRPQGGLAGAGVESLNGVPASIEPGPPASVTLLRHGLEIRIMARYAAITPDQLRSVAETLR